MSAILKIRFILDTGHTLYTHHCNRMVILVLVSKNSSSFLQEWQCFGSHAQTHSHVR